jgi:ubiquinone biosynthesis protein UbiJ
MSIENPVAQHLAEKRLALVNRLGIKSFMHECLANEMRQLAQQIAHLDRELHQLAKETPDGRTDEELAQP